MIATIAVLVILSVFAWFFIASLEPLKAAKRLRHGIAHWLGWNTGTVETWWDGPVLWVGFRCDCGQMKYAEPTGTLRDMAHVENED